MIKKILICMSLLAALLLASFGAQAQALREYYACNFIDDADMDELMEARDYMLEHLEMGGMEPVATFLWTPLKTNNDFDFLWFNQYENMEQFGTLMDEYLINPHGQMIQARFDSIAECITGLVTHQQIYNGGELNVTNPPVLVNSSACTLKDGHTMAEVTAVVDRFVGMIDRRGSHDASTGFMQMPLVSSAGVDVFFFSVFENVTAWTAAESSMRGSPGAPAIGADFNDLVRCNTSMWQGQNIVPGG